MPVLAYFLGASLVLQFARADYDWIDAPLSIYLIGSGSGWLVAGFFALGAGILGVGLGLHTHVQPTPLKSTALGLFIVAALATCAVALVPTDLPGGPNPTLHGMLHFAVASLAFLSISMAMLVQSWCLRGDPHWTRYFRKAFGLAVLTFVSLVVYALWRALPRGVSEKLVIMLIVLWLLNASHWLMQTRSTLLEADPA
jgi:hypothetical membrane protein